MVNYFNDFANLCFERFGNRVKYWITFNNPWVCPGSRVGRSSGRASLCSRPSSYGCRCVFQSVAVEGYETGEHAPGLRMKGSGAYRVAHHIIKVSPWRWSLFYPGDSSWVSHTYRGASLGLMSNQQNKNFSFMSGKYQPNSHLICFLHGLKYLLILIHRSFLFVSVSGAAVS